MEAWDAIRARRKIDGYEQRPVEDEKLERILEAGRRAPSSRNQQRWHFVLVRDRDQVRRLSEVWRGAAHIAEAPAAIAVVAPVTDDLQETASINFDLGQAVMSMMIAAADLGIGTRHAAVEDHDLAAEILGLPQDLRLMWMFGLGYPVGRPLTPVGRPDRRSFDDVVHLECW
ncbi:MAG: nitroreductase family protein [Acidimicrobiia bacterium]